MLKMPLEDAPHAPCLPIPHAFSAAPTLPVPATWASWAPAKYSTLPKSEVDPNSNHREIKWVLSHFCVEINKQKPHLKWSREATSKNSHTRHSTHSNLTLKGRKVGTLHLQQEVLLLNLSCRKQIPPCQATAQPMGDCHSSANEKSPYFKLCVSSKGLFRYNRASKVHKRAFFFLCFYGLEPRLPFTQHVHNCNSSLFLNKPILLKKYLSICLGQHLQSWSFSILE